jgi:poly(3-hydroxybutyrate) depolymerase
MEALTKDGAVVAFPQGGLSIGSGFEWDLERDAEFLNETIATLSDQFHEARSEVCMAGMSGGARMSSSFAATHSGRVMLLGAIAGLRAPAVSTLEHPVRVLAFHGTSDRINPFGGGSTPRWNESVLDAAKAWARANGHLAEPDLDQVTPTLTRVDFGAEMDPGPVTLWISRGAGHTWPGSRMPVLLRLYLGRTSHEIDATAEVWRAAASLGEA